MAWLKVPESDVYACVLEAGLTSQEKRCIKKRLEGKLTWEVKADGQTYCTYKDGFRCRKEKCGDGDRDKKTSLKDTNVRRHDKGLRESYQQREKREHKVFKAARRGFEER